MHNQLLEPIMAPWATPADFCVSDNISEKYNLFKETKMVKAKITSEWIQHSDGIGKQFKITIRESTSGQILSELTSDFPKWELPALRQTSNFNLKDFEKVAREMSIKVAEQFIGGELDFI